MNKIKVVLIALVIIIVALVTLYGIRVSIQNQINPTIEIETVGEEITSTGATYISETGDEAYVNYYNNNTASLTIISNDEYKDIQFTHATSASGARYENIEKGLVLWEKAPELTIYKNDEQLFFGKEIYYLEKEKINKLLPNKTWVWTQTFDDTGPLAHTSRAITPLRKDAFTLVFRSDGKVEGTTDCNSFTGTYYFNEYNGIHFSSFVSTLMFCENSQEQEFISMLKDKATFINVFEEELILQNNQTIYFKRATQ